MLIDQVSGQDFALCSGGSIILGVTVVVLESHITYAKGTSALQTLSPDTSSQSFSSSLPYLAFTHTNLV